MDKKEEKKDNKDKSFNIEDFYRKLGVWLLVLLLIVILTIGTVLIVMQKNILDKVNSNFTHKSVTEVINVNSPQE